jgi:hypothetical protein
MSAKEKISIEITRLLHLLPGVSVLQCSHKSESSCFELMVGCKTSMLAIQHSSTGANISLEPWVREAELGSWAERFSPILCNLSAPTTPFDMIECGHLQLLGIHLLWELHRIGLITEPAANMLLEQWNGAPAGGRLTTQSR